ncbi:MAG: AAA family ATPase [Pelolinea sp.]|nr:AAA family ATPase [Pelolinea sp.]
MKTTTQSTTILVVSKNPSVIESTRTTLAKEKILKLIEKEMTSENLFPVIAEIQPDVILLDFEFQQHPFDLVDKIASKYSMCAVVAILPESEKVDSDRVLLSGARDFIQYPYQSDNLVTTIKRVIELLERNQAPSSLTPVMDTNVKPKNMFTIFSPKGGVGTTTISTNLAISLHKTLKEDVLVIDGKHLFGHIALYYNLRTGNSITDLIAHAGNLDERLIKQVVVRHTSGVHVLPSPISIAQAQGIKPEDLFKVIQSLQMVFPNIIIDGGNNLNENTVTYMDSSDKILLVLNPDIASMRDVKQFMEISATLSYPKDKTLLILNLTGRKADVKKEEIENILKMKIFGMIPADGNLALSSLNEGVPILLKKPHHPISKAFNDITKELVKIIQTSKT